MLRLGASVERASEHPLAVAIVKAAEQRGVAILPVADFDSPAGKGALGKVEGRSVALGNASFIGELGVDVAAAFADAYNNLVRALRNYEAQEVEGGLGKGGKLKVGN